MKVSWLSNAPWTATGYGQQTRIFAPLLNEFYDVAITASWGLGGNKTTWEGIPVYPGGFDAYGNDVAVPYALEHLGHADKGWLFILYDAWVYANEDIRTLHNAVWCPVDHDPLPHPVLNYFQTMNGVPIAMSKFGQSKFADYDIEALYIPHGIDDAYEPKPRVEGREALGLPEDAFVVGMNAANKGRELHRKGFSQAFEAFTTFAQQHDDVLLYIHTEPTGMAGTVGWDLGMMAAMYGIEDKVVFPDPQSYRLGVPVEGMPWLYSSFDVLLNASYGEGFGIPIVEAQACGVPVIVTDHTSMPELVGDGWVVPGINLYHERMRSWWKIPDPKEIAAALTESYLRPTGASLTAGTFAEGYRASNVFDRYMLPVFVGLQERLDPVPVPL